MYLFSIVSIKLIMYMSIKKYHLPKFYVVIFQLFYPISFIVSKLTEFCINYLLCLCNYYFF